MDKGDVESLDKGEGCGKGKDERGAWVRIGARASSLGSGCASAMWFLVAGECSRRPQVWP